MKWDEKKKLSEREDLNKFLPLLNLKSYQILDDNRECPDFVIKIDDQKIGIEHTHAFQGKIGKKGSYYKKQREIHRLIGEKIVDEINELVEFTFFLDIHFNMNANFKNPLNISHNIIETIKHKITLFKKEKRLVIDAFDDYGSKILPEGVNNVFLEHLPNIDCSIYFESGAVIMPKFDDYVLNDILQIKEMKLDKYDRFHQNWLLIVLEKFYEDSFGEIALNNIPKTSFDKIFLLKCMDSEYVTIK